MKQPQKLSIKEQFERFKVYNGLTGNLYFHDGFAVIQNLNGIFTPFLVTDTPYLLEDYRLGLVKKGSMRAIINLQEVAVSPGTVLFITPGSISEPLWISDDFEVTGMGLPGEMFRMAHHEQLPDIFNGQRLSGWCMLSSAEAELLDGLFTMLWNIVNTENMGKDVIYHAIATITSYYNNVFTARKEVISSPSAAQEIFNRFIYLVNTNAQSQRQLAFYADKMCVTERYLGTTVRQVSGVTAKEWIDRAVIVRAKVMLRHRNLHVAQISEELGFPNVSFFCKYFKRLVGCTPKDYRLGEG